jgi:hypothetical protein
MVNTSYKQNRIYIRSEIIPIGEKTIQVKLSTHHKTKV